MILLIALFLFLPENGSKLASQGRSCWQCLWHRSGSAKAINDTAPVEHLIIKTNKKQLLQRLFICALCSWVSHLYYTYASKFQFTRIHCSLTSLSVDHTEDAHALLMAVLSESQFICLFLLNCPDKWVRLCWPSLPTSEWSILAGNASTSDCISDYSTATQPDKSRYATIRLPTEHIAFYFSCHCFCLNYNGNCAFLPKQCILLFRFFVVFHAPASWLWNALKLN